MAGYRCLPKVWQASVVKMLGIVLTTWRPPTKASTSLSRLQVPGQSLHDGFGLCQSNAAFLLVNLDGLHFSRRVAGECPDSIRDRIHSRRRRISSATCPGIFPGPGIQTAS